MPEKLGKYCITGLDQKVKTQKSASSSFLASNQLVKQPNLWAEKLFGLLTTQRSREKSLQLTAKTVS